MTLLVMAAGMGSRFGGLKQIEPVGPNGEFILDYSIYDAVASGFTKVVFIIKEENLEIFKETIGHRIESKVKVEYAFQKLDDIPLDIKVTREKPWGTGQAVLCAKDLIDGNFAVINADDFYGRDCFIKMAEYLKSASKESNNYALIGYEAGNTLGKFGAVKRGVCKASNGYVTTIIESSVERKDDYILAAPLDGTKANKIKDTDLVSMNAFCFTKGLFEYLKEGFVNFLSREDADLVKGEFLLPEVIKDLINRNKCDVKLLKTNAIWYGITYKEDKNELVTEINNLIDKKVYKNDLWH